MSGFGYSNAPSPQSQAAIVSEQNITVSLLIRLIAKEIFPGNFIRITWILLNRTSILIPEVCAYWGRHVDGGNKTKHTSNHKCCSKTVIHSGIQTALFKLKKEKLDLKSKSEYIEKKKAPFTLLPIPSFQNAMHLSM